MSNLLTCRLATVPASKRALLYHTAQLVGLANRRGGPTSELCSMLLYVAVDRLYTKWACFDLGLVCRYVKMCGIFTCLSEKRSEIDETALQSSKDVRVSLCIFTPQKQQQNSKVLLELSDNRVNNFYCHTFPPPNNCLPYTTVP